MLIDINCDLGEGAGNDALIMPHITSANIACGGHAGTVETMRETIHLALKYGVKIGAHPSYPDPDHFGRISMTLNGADLRETIIRQVSLLKKLTEEAGGKLTHVKPHGALYNDAARDRNISRILADAVYQVDPTLIFVGLAGSVMIDQARERGLAAASEVFADRNYTDEGFLVSRREPHAMITDLNRSLEHVSRMFREGEVETVHGKIISIQADTVCIHGDEPGAPELAIAIKKVLLESRFTWHALGDSAILIRLGNEISSEINRRVHALAQIIEQSAIEGFDGLIPAYADLTVIFKPGETSYPDFLSRLKEVVAQHEPGEPSEVEPFSEIQEIPVVYDDESGPDLPIVADHAGLTIEEVIAKHAANTYRVYMMGFTPGFCYLGGLDPQLETPRKSDPRLKIPAGSVGIAGMQTGIYPIESPGGWQIIGRTPLVLFDPDREQPFLCRAGMSIRFRQMEVAVHSAPASASAPAKPEITNVIRPAGVVRVIDPGMLTTIQDRGRTGYRAYGMPVSGALDPASMQWANQLAGNPPDAAVLEITVKGPTLEFNIDTVIALAGADLGPMLDGEARSTGQAIPVRSGQILSFAGLRSGLRAYLAVSGGFDVPVVMGSKSTYLRGKLGGFGGRALQQGDELRVGEGGGLGEGGGAKTDRDLSLPLHYGRVGVGKTDRDLSLPLLYARVGDGKTDRDLSVPPLYGRVVPGPKEVPTIRYVPGPEADRFTSNGLSTFLKSEYAISQYCDRMGIRLDGPAVELTAGADILSSGVIPGTIQVTGDGQPIILMNDCQTTGGYTRIGCVISEDLPILAQLMPGRRIRFEELL